MDEMNAIIRDKVMSAVYDILSQTTWEHLEYNDAEASEDSRDLVSFTLVGMESMRGNDGKPRRPQRRALEIIVREREIGGQER